METIPKEQCRKIGFIRKTHGVKGELIFEFESDFKNSISRAKRFFIEISGLLVPFFVSENGLTINTDKTAFLTFNWIEDEENARRLAGREVYLFSNEIHEKPAANFNYNLPGYFLVDKQLGEVGIISRVDDFSDNIVLSVRYKNRDILVPYNEDILVSVDHKRRILTLDLPPGIL
jgi:16S rRNA processing protein RimM